jgi:S1-C subfamily serine protease
VAARAGKPDAKGGAVGLYFDVTQVDGAFVKSVRANGPGAVAGIRAGDVVTAINGKVVLNGREADELILAAVPGTSLTITIERDGITLAYRVTVEKFGREEAEFYSSVMDAQYQQPARNAIRKMNR